MNKQNWLLFLVFGLLIFITCGNEPPEKFYEGTPEDDSAIVSVLETRPEFLKTSTPFDSHATKNYIPLPNFQPVDFPIGDSFFRVDSPLIKQNIDQIANQITKLTRFRDLWYAKDTTCTVYLWDTLTIISNYHWSKRYTGHYDSMWVSQTGETTWVLHTIEIDSTGGFDSIVNIQLEGCRHIFLEPKRDTTGAIIEPREWVLKRISYGTYYLPNRGADYPMVLRTIVGSKGDIDTILIYSYDTLYTGHAMNRLRHIDSLLEYSVGDTLDIKVEIYPYVTDTMVFYLAGIDTVRTQLPGFTSTSGSGKLVVKGEKGKIVNFYIGVFTRAGYYYKKPEKSFTGVIWLVPIRIKQD